MVGRRLLTVFEFGQRWFRQALLGTCRLRRANFLKHDVAEKSELCAVGPELPKRQTTLSERHLNKAETLSPASFDG